MAAASSRLFYINKAFVNMREEPNSDSKVASQALYGERIKVENTSGDWVYIRTPDDYPGWVEKDSYLEREEVYPHPKNNGIARVSSLKAHIYHTNDTEWGPKLTVPFGTRLQILEKSDPRWFKVVMLDGKEYYLQKGDAVEINKPKEKQDLVGFSKKFLEAKLPYTWGGRASSEGFDCSGFVQRLYGEMGVDLERNSSAQVNDPRFKTVPVEQLEAGDLIFFGKPEGKIGHVGMYIGNNEFVHTSPLENKPHIRISKLSDAAWGGSQEAKYPVRVGRQLIKKVEEFKD